MKKHRARRTFTRQCRPASTRPKLMREGTALPAVSDSPASPSRRAFLGSISGIATASMAAAAVGLEPLLGSKSSEAKALDGSPQNAQQRRTSARRTRLDAAQLAFTRPLPAHPSNGEETAYGGTRIANFSKGLPHNNLGEVNASAYDLLLAALASGDNADFEAIPLSGVRPLRNPQACLAFDLEGPDSHHVAIRPAPRIDAPENSSEAAELYWMALGRDVNFTDYGSDPTIAAAAVDLSLLSDFRGPKIGSPVTPATIFRGNTSGDLTGPYLSQFLVKDIPYGSLTISQRQQTVWGGLEYMTTFGTWLDIQNGAAADPDQFDSRRR